MKSLREALLPLTNAGALKGRAAEWWPMDSCTSEKKWHGRFDLLTYLYSDQCEPVLTGYSRGSRCVMPLHKVLLIFFLHLQLATISFHVGECTLHGHCVAMAPSFALIRELLSLKHSRPHESGFHGAGQSEWVSSQHLRNPEFWNAFLPWVKHIFTFLELLTDLCSWTQNWVKKSSQNTLKKSDAP